MSIDDDFDGCFYASLVKYCGFDDGLDILWWPCLVGGVGGWIGCLV